MKLLRTYPFEITDSTVPYERYPQLLQGAFSFSFQIANETYYVYVMYAEAINSAVVNIYDNKNEIIISNMPIISEIEKGYPNLLARFKFQQMYALTYNIKNQQFILYDLEDEEE